MAMTLREGSIQSVPIMCVERELRLPLLSLYFDLPVLALAIALGGPRITKHSCVCAVRVRECESADNESSHKANN